MQSFSAFSQQGSPSMGYESQNIDDIVYRYSAELDRSFGGAPTEGIYARDGIWDDDEDDTDLSVNRASSSTFGRKNVTVKGRSRSGTMASVIRAASPPPLPLPSSPREDGGWGWGRKVSSTSTATASATEQDRTVKGKKSFSKLRGKGRRGELSVAVNLADESFEALATPPTTSTSGLGYASPTTTSTLLTPTLHMGDTSVDSAQSASNSSKPKLSWKKSMSKIFRSKSSAALKENVVPQAPPPVPKMPSHTLPHSKARPLGKPFSSSTPPMPLRDSRAHNSNGSFGQVLSYSQNLAQYNQSPTTVISSPSWTSRDIPFDPFASSLDLSSNNLAIASSPPPTETSRFSFMGHPERPRLPRNSPSLKDLKAFLPRAMSSDKLSKARSMANIAGKDRSGPSSAPPTRTEFFQAPIRPSALRRISSSSLIQSMPTVAIGQGESPVMPSQAPVESPPLLPPNPPYFPAPASTRPLASRSSSLSISAQAISAPPSSTSSSSSDVLTTPGPSAPLPPLPLPAPVSTPLAGTPQPTSPIQRSGSGHVLLPRSRSTSMSLKAPPTSSSFFDLYEQLGIWPTSAEKPRDKSVSPDIKRSGSAALLSSPLAASPSPSPVASRHPTAFLKPETSVDDDEADEANTSMVAQPASTAGVTPSISATFSAASWDAAINAFPVIEDSATIAGPSTDFDDVPGVETPDAAVEGSFPGMMMMSTASNEAGSSSTQRASTSTSASNKTAQASSSAMRSRPVGAASYQMSRHNTGSGGSSRNSSRSRRPRHRPAPAEGAWAAHSSSSSEDDEPLSKAHPEAAAAQAQRRSAAHARREARRVMMAAAQPPIVARDNRGRHTSQKALGRNPGGETGWNGEGGVPADILTTRLESLLMSRAATSYRAAEDIRGEASAQPHHRSFTEPIDPRNSQQSTQSKPVERSLTSRSRAEGSANPYTQSIASSACGGPVSSRPTTPSTAHHSFVPTRPLATRKDSASSSVQSHGPAPRLPPMPPMSRQNTAQNPAEIKVDLTRSDTTATTASRVARSRAQSVSSSQRHGMAGDENTIRTRSTTEPVPALPGTGAAAASPVAGPSSRPAGKVSYVKAYVGAFDGKKLTLEVHPDTSAKDIIAATYQSGELPDAGPGGGWVLCEVFAELGSERLIREYERLGDVMKGWNASSVVYNCFVFKVSHRASSLSIRGAPNTAPFLGSWVQYETKKGKWSKRCLETRGGQIFLAKNEKGKDEMHLSTSFFDVYIVTRPYGAPKPCVFVLKRNEPAVAFEDPSEYCHYFSCDQAVGDKLLRALFDAKSFGLAPTAVAASGPMGGGGRRPTLPPKGEPLLKIQGPESAFTGKGLLKV